MAWVKVIGLLLQLVLMVLQYLERQKAINEGEARAIQILVERANAILADGRLAADNVSDDPDVLLADPFNRHDKGDRPDNPENTVRGVLPGAVPVSGGHTEDTKTSST